MSNLANKLPERTQARLLSKKQGGLDPDDDLPPHLAKDIRNKLTPDENETPDLDLKTPIYYASMIAMVIFVYFNMY